MKSWFVAWLAWAGIVAILGLAFVGATRIYNWRTNVNERGYLSEISASYLFGPSGVKDKDGKPVRRADLIDRLLSQSLEK